MQVDQTQAPLRDAITECRRADSLAVDAELSTDFDLPTGTEPRRRRRMLRVLGSLGGVGLIDAARAPGFRVWGGRR